MRKADVIIIITVLAVCAALLLFFRFGGQKDSGQISAEIYIAGQLMKTVPLDGEEHDLTLLEGKIVLSIENDGVAVKFAECPSQACAHTGKITLPGQMITCLPNRVIIKLTGSAGSDQEVDVIAK